MDQDIQGAIYRMRNCMLHVFTPHSSELGRTGQRRSYKISSRSRTASSFLHDVGQTDRLLYIARRSEHSTYVLEGM